jgi:hypothetical protein
LLEVVEVEPDLQLMVELVELVVVDMVLIILEFLILIILVQHQ